MFNNTIVTNISGLIDYNYNFSQVCLINQYKIIEETQKLPQTMYFFILAAFIILIIYFILRNMISHTKAWDYISDAPLLLAWGLMAWFLVVDFYFTFQLTELQLRTIEYYIMYVSIGIILLIIISFYKRIIKWIKSLGGGEDEGDITNKDN